MKYVSKGSEAEIKRGPVTLKSPINNVKYDRSTEHKMQNGKPFRKDSPNLAVEPSPTGNQASTMMDSLAIKNQASEKMRSQYSVDYHHIGNINEDSQM